MSARRVLLVVAVACLFAAASFFLGFTATGNTPALAQALDSSRTIPYSGQLKDASGVTVADGAYDFAFSLYDTSEGGSLLWSETQTGVAVTAGAFTTSLGSAKELPAQVFELKQAWLEVGVRGQGEAEYTLLSPRQSLSTDAPMAIDALACPHNHFTDYWPGSNASYGVRVDQNSTGDGLRAYSMATASNYAAVYAVNSAASGDGRGVYASSSYGTGVYSASTYNDGLEAYTSAPFASAKSAIFAHSTGGNGVWGVSTDRYGVHGSSTNSFGVDAVGGGDASWSDFIGDLVLGGTRGEIFAFGDVMSLYSNNWVAVELDNNNNTNAQLEVWNGGDSLVFTVNESGNTWAAGTKSALVQTDSYGDRLLYSVESPEVWFEDLGAAVLVKGLAIVSFEPIFAETANLNTDYRVFLTPVCSEPVLLYITAKTSTGFTVQGVTLDNQPSSCSFDYRVMAKRLGYEGTRLETVDPTANSHGR